MKKLLILAGLTAIVFQPIPITAQQMEPRTNTMEPSTKQVIDTNDRNNNFYDNEVIYSLKGSEIDIAGEIKNPGKSLFTGLQKRSVIVKETRYVSETENKFVGAYRYDGYSLFDILTNRYLDKKNAGEFAPIIDLYVIVENSNGEKVVLSWGEIFYPTNLHQIIIATDVSRIVPSKSKDLWPLPTETKLVVAGDLLTERNISNPVRITVVSYRRSIKVNREIDPVFSAAVNIFVENKAMGTLTDLPASLQKQTYHTIFYGRGRGIHSTQPFSGVMLKEVLAPYVPVSDTKLATGLIVLVGKDGYRAVYSYSEVFNRNDQAEVLLVDCSQDTESGKFRVFPAADFFSDRAVKTVSAIYFENTKGK